MLDKFYESGDIHNQVFTVLRQRHRLQEAAAESQMAELGTSIRDQMSELLHQSRSERASSVAPTRHLPAKSQVTFIDLDDDDSSSSDARESNSNSDDESGSNDSRDDIDDGDSDTSSDIYNIDDIDDLSHSEESRPGSGAGSSLSKLIKFGWLRS